MVSEAMVGCMSSGECINGGYGAYWYRGGEPSLNPPPEYDEEPLEDAWYDDIEPPEDSGDDEWNGTALDASPPPEEPDWLQERLDGAPRLGGNFLAEGIR